MQVHDPPYLKQIFTQFVHEGSIICNDRLRAYRDNVEKMGYKWVGVDHWNHEFLRYDGQKRTFVLRSNMIDGQWTPLKEFTFKHCGVIAPSNPC